MIAPLLLSVLATAASAPDVAPKPAEDAPCCAVLELRQYTLKSGQRDVLIDLFEREFIEAQEALGIDIVGTFRDLDRPDRFVWIRGFADMPSRARALPAFYFGPVWQAHRDAANATMVDSDNVLLLRPADADAGFATPASPRAPIGTTERPSSRVLATIYSFPKQPSAEFVHFFDAEIAPVLAEAGAPPIARLETETAENNFPRLPVRAGDHVFIWFARFDSADALATFDARLAASVPWKDLSHKIATRLKSPPERLVLEPTARSRLR